MIRADCVHRVLTSYRLAPMKRLNSASDAGGTSAVWGDVAQNLPRAALCGGDRRLVAGAVELFGASVQDILFQRRPKFHYGLH